MIYERKDGQVFAKVLGITGDNVLIDSRWPAQHHDERKHHVVGGIARNVTTVTKRYFKERYGQESLA